MSLRLISWLGPLLLLLVASCAMEYAEDVGFIDRAVKKALRENLKDAKRQCPEGKLWEIQESCKHEPNCPG